MTYKDGKREDIHRGGGAFKRAWGRRKEHCLCSGLHGSMPGLYVVVFGSVENKSFDSPSPPGLTYRTSTVTRIMRKSLTYPYFQEKLIVQQQSSKASCSLLRLRYCACVACFWSMFKNKCHKGTMLWDIWSFFDKNLVIFEKNVLSAMKVCFIKYLQQIFIIASNRMYWIDLNWIATCLSRYISNRIPQRDVQPSCLVNVNIKQQGTHLAQYKPLHQSSAVAHVKVYWSREAPFCNDGCMTTVLVRDRDVNAAAMA